MGKISFGKVLDSLCCIKNDHSSNSCFCINSLEVEEDEEDLQLERKPLVSTINGETQVLRLKDVVFASKGSGSFRQFRIVRYYDPDRDSNNHAMHFHGCAKKVEKHVSKIEGVTSYKVDLETKTVVVIGEILPLEVLETISKVKNAQLWTAGI